MQIEVINVTGPNAVPGKKYQVIEVAYKADGKVNGKKLLSFSNPSLFNEVQKWQQGQFYEVSVKQDDKGYWQWINASLSDGSASAPSAITSGKSVSDFKKGNEDRYETAEERKLRQKYIIRQSSIGAAINTLSVGAKSPPTSSDVISLAKEYETYVFSVDEKPPVYIDDIHDDIPD